MCWLLFQEPAPRCHPDANVWPGATVSRSGKATALLKMDLTTNSKSHSLSFKVLNKSQF